MLGSGKFLFRLVQSGKILVGKLAYLFVLPKLPEPEVVEQGRRVGPMWIGQDSLELLFCTAKMFCGVCDVNQFELALQGEQQGLVPIEVRWKTRYLLVFILKIGKGWNGQIIAIVCDRERKFINKATDGSFAAVPVFIGLAGQQIAADASLLGEEAHFVGFFFQIVLVEIIEDETEKFQLENGTAVTGFFPVRGVFFVNGSIDGTCRKMEAMLCAPLIGNL